MLTEGAKILGPDQGRAGRLGGMGVRFMVSGDESGASEHEFHAPVTGGEIVG